MCVRASALEHSDHDLDSSSAEVDRIANSPNATIIVIILHIRVSLALPRAGSLVNG